MTARTIITRSISWLVAIVFVASLLLAAWPSTPAAPLITKSDWKIEGQAFSNVEPQRFELPDSMAHSPEATYWRTWNWKPTQATVMTSPFKPSRYMAIPYGGFAGDPGIRLDLRCVASGATRPIATARTNNQMTEVLIALGRNWCTGNVIVQAQSRSAVKYIEIGTPFSISWIDYYKNSFIGFAGIFAIVFLFALGLFLMPDATRILGGDGREHSPIAGLALIGTLGYAMFFVYFFSHTAGQIASGLVFAVTACLIGFIAVRHPGEMRELWRRRKLPILLWAAVAFTAYTLAMATYNGAGPWAVNALFTPVQWSSDNQFPEQISEYLFHGIDPRTLPYGVWQISDRPPLAYGLMAVLRFPSWIIANHGDGFYLYYQYALISGIIINSLWLIGLYYLLSNLEFKSRTICLIALVVAVTGFAIFNTLYIWPKMLGAAFGLVAFTLLFEPRRHLNAPSYAPYGQAFLWAALFSGLALESHGGTAFGVVAAILVATWYRGLPSPWLAVRAVLIGLAILVPWALWQHYEQPPGNALIKYAFSGDFGFTHRSQSVFDAIRHAYSQVTISSWFEMKLRALKMMFTAEASGCALAETAPISTPYGLARVQDFFHLVPSLRFLIVGFVPLLFIRGFNKQATDNRLLHYARVMVGTGFLSVGMYSLFAFHCYINHMQSYQAVLEIMVGLAICLFQGNRWYYMLCLKLSVLYGAIVWVIDPIAGAAYVRGVAVCCICVVALWAYRVLTKHESNDENETVVRERLG